MENQKWIARTKFTSGGKVYHCGCEIPAEALGRNARALERAGVIWNAPAHQPVAGLKPIDLPEQPPAPKKKPKLAKIMVRLRDPVASWTETFRGAREHFDNDSDTMDWLLSHAEARELNKLATKVACAEEKVRRGGRLQSITPNMVGL
jgi:hypothetical protein